MQLLNVWKAAAKRSAGKSSPSSCHILSDAQEIHDLEDDLGATIITAAELNWATECEWVRCAEDFLWCRSKFGLYVKEVQVKAIGDYIKLTLSQQSEPIVPKYPSPQFNMTKYSDDIPNVTKNQATLVHERNGHCSAKNNIVLSINPEYVKKILLGQKTVELRRRFPLKLWPVGVKAYIYATSPRKAMMGSMEIHQVLKLSLEEIWSQYGHLASIAQNAFNDYFDGLSTGYALILGNVQAFDQPIQLKCLQTKCRFHPPQSFSYVKLDLETAMKDEITIISH